MGSRLTSDRPLPSSTVSCLVGLPRHGALAHPVQRNVQGGTAVVVQHISSEPRSVAKCRRVTAAVWLWVWCPPKKRNPGSRVWNATLRLPTNGFCFFKEHLGQTKTCKTIAYPIPLGRAQPIWLCPNRLLRSRAEDATPPPEPPMPGRHVADGGPIRFALLGCPFNCFCCCYCCCRRS